MIGSRRSVWSAFAAFLLIAAVAVAGMSWVTSLQLQLNDLQAAQSQRSKLREAMGRLDLQVQVLLIPEIAREPTDYFAYFLEDAETGYTSDHRRIDVEKIIKQSPIAANGPRYDWIDLYFHVGEEGDRETDLHWVSPQTQGIGYSARAFQAMEWLRSSMTVAELAEHVDRARTRHRETYARMSSFDADDRTVQVADNVGLRRRMNRSLQTQMQMLPPAQCIEGDFIPPNHNDEQDMFVCSPPMNLALTAEPLAIFWTEGDDGTSQKLMFVRTGHADSVRFYQGFVADWHRLKPDLLAVFDQSEFPGADLIPLTDEESETVDPDFKVGTLPLRFAGTIVPDEAAVTARQSVVQGQTVAWAVTLAVLCLAGVAVANLVALSNRRLQFAYAVTHELRTPLTTFRLYTDMLSARLVPADAQQEYLDTLNRESVRLSRIVQGVLEYSRLENQKVRLNPKEVKARDLLDKMQESIQSRCDLDGIRTVAASELPDGAVVHTDLELVGQITGVLLDNAMRHARQSDDPAVRLRLAERHGMLTIHISDSGPGVARRDARQIFKPFRRGSNAESTGQRGIGLGLALARSWAGLLGGRLELIDRNDPELGGAHFCLSIPKGRTERAAIGSAGEEAQPAHLPGSDDQASAANVGAR